MNNTINSVGIVGFGAMGQLVGERMFEGCEVVAYDPALTSSPVDGIELVSMEEVAASDAVVFAVPASALFDVAFEVAKTDSLSMDALLVDVSSVKQYPANVFDRLMPNMSGLLLSHPLFGPQSAANGVEGHRVIVTESHGDKAIELQERWKALGLDILEMSSDEHDRHMAAVLAVPFVMGRMATMIGLEDPVELATPSRHAIRQLEVLDELQSDDLFTSVIQFNHHARGMLDSMKAALDTIHSNGLAAEAAMAETERILSMNPDRT